MKSLLAVILFACAAAGAWASCQQVTPQEYFKSFKIVGVWYLMSFSGPGDETELKCIKITLSSVPDTKYMSSTFQGIAPDGSRKVIGGNGTVVDPNVPGRFDVIYKNVPYDLVVVKSDYDTYLVSVMCTKENEVSRIFISSRTRKLANDVLEDLKKTLQEEGVDISSMGNTEQSNCE